MTPKSLNAGLNPEDRTRFISRAIYATFVINILISEARDTGTFSPWAALAMGCAVIIAAGSMPFLRVAYAAGNRRQGVIALTCLIVGSAALLALRLATQTGDRPPIQLWAALGLLVIQAGCYFLPWRGERTSRMLALIGMAGGLIGLLGPAL